MRDNRLSVAFAISREPKAFVLGGHVFKKLIKELRGLVAVREEGAGDIKVDVHEETISRWSARVGTRVKL